MTGALIILAVTAVIGVLLWAWERFRTQRHGPSLHHHHAVGEESMRRSRKSSVISHQSSVSDNSQLTTDNSQLTTDNSQLTTPPAVCCGLHAICEKTGQINEPPVYYDDEELDRFAGRDSSDYTDEETEEFRDVLLTLLPSDAPGWSISLEKRRINLPDPLKPELELLLTEA